MSTYGRTVAPGVAGVPVEVALDHVMEWKTVGLTIDWATVAAVVSDTTLPDNNVILAGTKGLRFGQILTMITASKKYGPYDPAATDGRQLLARGNAYILNETLMEKSFGGYALQASDHPAVFDGGRAWKDRVLMTTGAASLAAGPTVANVEATFPDLIWVTNP